MERIAKKPNLLALRETYGWTQQEVAKKLGISRSYYGMLEAGHRNPTVLVAKKLTKVFSLNNWYMFFDETKVG